MVDIDYSQYTLEELDEAYLNWRKLAYNASQMRNAKRYGNCEWHLVQIEKAKDALRRMK